MAVLESPPSPTASTLVSSCEWEEANVQTTRALVQLLHEYIHQADEHKSSSSSASASNSATYRQRKGSTCLERWILSIANTMTIRNVDTPELYNQSVAREHLPQFRKEILHDYKLMTDESFTIMTTHMMTVMGRVEQYYADHRIDASLSSEQWIDETDTKDGLRYKKMYTFRWTVRLKQYYERIHNSKTMMMACLLRGEAIMDTGGQQLGPTQELMDALYTRLHVGVEGYGSPGNWRLAHLPHTRVHSLFKCIDVGSCGNVLAIHDNTDDEKEEINSKATTTTSSPQMKPNMYFNPPFMEHSLLACMKKIESDLTKTKQRYAFLYAPVWDDADFYDRAAVSPFLLAKFTWKKGTFLTELPNGTHIPGVCDTVFFMFGHPPHVSSEHVAKDIEEFQSICRSALIK